MAIQCINYLKKHQLEGHFICTVWFNTACPGKRWTAWGDLVNCKHSKFRLPQTGKVVQLRVRSHIGKKIVLRFRVKNNFEFVFLNVFLIFENINKVNDFACIRILRNGVGIHIWIRRFVSEKSSSLSFLYDRKQWVTR